MGGEEAGRKEEVGGGRERVGGGVVEADLDFARKFVREREALIGVLGEGDPTLLAMAIETIEECHRKIANRNSVS